MEPYDTRAAIECAAILRSKLTGGGKRKAIGAGTTWAKAKFDRQIVAIAKVIGAETIYSDDRDVRALGARAKIAVVSCGELPLPPEDPNLNLFEHQLKPIDS